jgi:hypothetical protein
MQNKKTPQRKERAEMTERKPEPVLTQPVTAAPTRGDDLSSNTEPIRVLASLWQWHKNSERTNVMVGGSTSVQGAR